MKRVVWLCLAVLLAMVPVNAQDDENPVIGFMQIVSHPALNDARDGAAATLTAAGYVDGESATFLFGNAEGDFPTLATIVQDFIDKGADVIIATSTPALQSAYSATLDMEGMEPLVIFNSVTSPYAAGIAAAACVHPAWVIGTQALAPFEDILPLVGEVAPGATRVGYIYNPAEANSVANTDIIVPLAEAMGLDLQIQTISNTSEVPTAAEALVSRGVEVFLVATDSTLVAGLEGLVAVANENGIPIVASDTSSAPRGAVVARGLDYYQDGVDSGMLAAAYLRGELDVATARINRQVESTLAINLNMAAEQGATISADLLAGADVVIEGDAVTTAERMTLTAADIDELLPAFLENVACTQEEIDTQMAELEAASE
jgi:putative tryptophan/tyrosine transport system substrate-binding protein